MGKADDIRGIRDAVTAVDASRVVFESRVKRVPQKTDAGEEKRRVPADWKDWIHDVNEAVEMFIGMGIDVLPRVPWKKWYLDGLSAVVAAKNASQMYEDSKEDGSFDFAADVKVPKKRIAEQFPVGRDSYGDWIKKVSKRLEDEGEVLVAAMERTGMGIEDLHALYNAEYDPVNVANSILQAKPKGAVPESKLRRRLASLDEFADKLGMKLKGRRVQEEEDDDSDDDEPEEDVTEDEGDGSDNGEEEQIEETDPGAEVEPDQDNGVTVADEDMGVAFVWPIEKPQGYIGCFDLKTEQLLYSWGLRCGNCGKEVYERAMNEAMTNMRQKGRDKWLSVMTERNVQIPTGKTDMGGIDYHEERGFIEQLGAALGRVNAEIDGKGSEDVSGDPETTE